MTRKYGQWTEAMRKYVRTNYPTGNIGEMEKVLGQSPDRIKKMASRLGVRRVVVVRQPRLETVASRLLAQEPSCPREQARRARARQLARAIIDCGGGVLSLAHLQHELGTLPNSVRHVAGESPEWFDLLGGRRDCRCLDSMTAIALTARGKQELLGVAG